MTKFTNPPTAHASAGSYSHTAVVPAGTELVFLSGQVGARPDGSTPPNLPEQADKAFANIVQLLAAHGLQPDAIVKLTLFNVSGHDIQVVRNARIKHLGNHRPTSTAVIISRLADPKWFVEVEAVAARSAQQ